MTKGSNEDFYDVLASINLMDDVATRFHDVIERPPKTKGKDKQQIIGTNTKNQANSQAHYTSESIVGSFVVVGDSSLNHTDSEGVLQ